MADGPRAVHVPPLVATKGPHMNPTASAESLLREDPDSLPAVAGPAEPADHEIDLEEARLRRREKAE